MPRFALPIFLAVLLYAIAACSRPPELVGVDNPEFPAAGVQTAVRQKVFIATTRESSEAVGAFYSEQRAPELGLASVVVSIPPNHVTGQIERSKNLPPDPRTEFAIVEPTVYESDNAFVARLNQELAKLPPNKREVLLFVHGYNNTISDSILRIAQFAEDTDFSGVPVLFSWASAAKVPRYVYDLNSALVARPRIQETSDILSRTNATGFSLFAHSMGAFLTVEAIVQAQIAGTYNGTGRLNNIMLAAPDIDLDLFKAQLSLIPERNRNFYVFVSQDDKALNFAKFLSGGIVRAGAADAESLAKLGVTVIDLSKIHDSSSGTHSKFAGSPEVVRLIGFGLKDANLNAPARGPSLIEVLDGVPVIREIDR